MPRRVVSLAAHRIKSTRPILIGLIPHGSVFFGIGCRLLQVPRNKSIARRIIFSNAYNDVR